MHFAKKLVEFFAISFFIRKFINVFYEKKIKTKLIKNTSFLVVFFGKPTFIEI